MGYKIDEIEGIGDAYSKKLAVAGITNTSHLLKLCCSAAGRKSVAKETGLTTKQLLSWADMADLMRITGVGRQFGELLKASGVDTIKELRVRVSENLHEKMAKTNEKKNLCKVVPSAARIQDWIDLAKKMDPVITH